MGKMVNPVGAIKGKNGKMVAPAGLPKWQK